MAIPADDIRRIERHIRECRLTQSIVTIEQDNDKWINRVGCTCKKCHNDYSTETDYTVPVNSFKLNCPECGTARRLTIIPFFTN